MSDISKPFGGGLFHTHHRDLIPPWVYSPFAEQSAKACARTGRAGRLGGARHTGRLGRRGARGALRRRSARKTARVLPQAALQAGFRGATRAKRRRGRACRATRVRARRRVSARVRGVLPRNAAAQAGYLGCTGRKPAFFRQKTPFFGASRTARGQKRRKTRPLRGGFLRKTPKTSRVSRRRVTGLGSKRLPSGPPFSGAALSQTKVRRRLSQSKARKPRGEKRKKPPFFAAENALPI